MAEPRIDLEGAEFSLVPWISHSGRRQSTPHCTSERESATVRALGHSGDEVCSMMDRLVENEQIYA